MQYLDALEGLRSHGFPDEPIITKRFEILQRFIEGSGIQPYGVNASSSMRQRLP